MLGNLRRSYNQGHFLNWSCLSFLLFCFVFQPLFCVCGGGSLLLPSVGYGLGVQRRLSALPYRWENSIITCKYGLFLKTCSLFKGCLNLNFPVMLPSLLMGNSIFGDPFCLSNPSFKIHALLEQRKNTFQIINVFGLLISDVNCLAVCPSTYRCQSRPHIS